MNQLMLAARRAVRGPIATKQENEMLLLRKRVQELEALVEKPKENESKLPTFPWAWLAPPFVYIAAPHNTTKEEIIKAVCEYYEISRSEIVGNRRTVHVTFPRQVAMYLCCEHTTSSLTAIGLHFNGKDHTTIMHARRKIIGLLGSDFGVRKQVSDIEQGLHVVR